MDDKNQFVIKDGNNYEILTQDDLNALLNEKLEDIINGSLAKLKNSIEILESQLDENVEKTNLLGEAIDSIMEKREMNPRASRTVSKSSVGVQVNIPCGNISAAPSVMVEMSLESMQQQDSVSQAGPSRSLSDREIDSLQGTADVSVLRHYSAGSYPTKKSPLSRPELAKMTGLPVDDRNEVPNSGITRYSVPIQMPGSSDAVPGFSAYQIDNSKVFYVTPSQLNAFSCSMSESQPNVSDEVALDVSENQASPRVGFQSGTTTHSVASGNPGRNTSVSSATPTRNLRYPPPLPSQPRPPLESQYLAVEPPPKPVLKIERCNEGIVLAWNLTLTSNHADMESYILYVCQMSNTIPFPVWKKLSTFKALPLPMACTLTHFAGGGCYNFAVRGMDRYHRIGRFSDIASINMKPSYNIGL